MLELCTGSPQVLISVDSVVENYMTSSNSLNFERNPWPK
jgi:hypothetical protein